MPENSWWYNLKIFILALGDMLYDLFHFITLKGVISVIAIMCAMEYFSRFFIPSGNPVPREPKIVTSSKSKSNIVPDAKTKIDLDSKVSVSTKEDKQIQNQTRSTEKDDIKSNS